MFFRRTITGVALGATLFSHHMVQAADAVYQGECNRARTVQQQSTIDKLVPHKRYEGIQRAQFANNKTASCEKNSLITFTLTQRSRSSSSVVFDMVRNDIFFGKQNGCAPVSLLNQPYTGTVTFTTLLSQQGEQCELYIKADWVHSGASKPTDFWNRVISMENGAFVISQPASSGGVYWTPLAFSGVNP